MPQEVEVKFRIYDRKELIRSLRRARFKQTTPDTHELNTLYDLPGQKLRKRGELLRLRQFGDEWILTHKAKGKAGRHKKRVERETKLENGRRMDGILHALGFAPVFRYEKYREEWSDGSGHVVLDRTPVGEIGEIEGPSRWIDRTARALGLNPKDYVTKAYADLFFEWKRRTRSPAKEMTFKAVGASMRSRNRQAM